MIYCIARVLWFNKTLSSATLLERLWVSSEPGQLLGNGLSLTGEVIGLAQVRLCVHTLPMAH